MCVCTCVCVCVRLSCIHGACESAHPCSKALVRQCIAVVGRRLCASRLQWVNNVCSYWEETWWISSHSGVAGPQSFVCMMFSKVTHVKYMRVHTNITLSLTTSSPTMSWKTVVLWKHLKFFVKIFFLKGFSPNNSRSVSIIFISGAQVI